MHAAERLGVDISDRTDDDVGLQFGFHGATLRSAPRRRKSAPGLDVDVGKGHGCRGASLWTNHNGIAGSGANGYDRSS